MLLNLSRSLCAAVLAAVMLGVPAISLAACSSCAGSVSTLQHQGIAILSQWGMGRFFYPLEYQSYIADASTASGVDPYLVCAVIKCESGFDASAVSNVGMKGLMQLSDEAAQDMASFGYVDSGQFSPDDLFDPQTNIRYGTAYLSYLLTRYKGDEQTAIVAYNAGLANADEWASNPEGLSDSIEFDETKAYLVAVQDAEEAYRSYYPDAFHA